MTEFFGRTALEKHARTAAKASGHAVHFERVCRYNDALAAARFRLDNGLKIVLLPDPRAALFAYQTWFKVGSKNEDPGATGLSHFLEHLMFKGTAKHPVGELDHEMERRGSMTNAATWVDWTYYHETLAAHGDNLETVIDFEADRMTGLIIDTKTFESELEVVKNERRQSVDNSPGGALSEELYSRAFTAHSYRRPVIGAMSHLEAMTCDHVTRYYQTYYAPNNTTVVVGGDINLVETLVAIARGYAKLSPQPQPPPLQVVEPRQIEFREFSLEKPVVAPVVVAAFHAPAQAAPEFAALELLSEVLVVGDNARLYKRLVTDEELASNVTGMLVPFAEPGLYEIEVNARPEASPRDIVRILQEELNALCRGVTGEELVKARNGLELALCEGLRNAEGVAELLGQYETNYGDFGMAFTAMERWAEVDKLALERIAAEVFREGNRTVGSVLPVKA